VFHPDDTIAAIASAPGGAARGIVRLSGPEAIRSLESWFTADEATDWQALRARRVIGGRLEVEGFHSLAPCDLYLWPTAASYTRQPTAEIHALGSPPLLAAILQTACRNGARLAQPGEFTLRAFLAGRLDLTQAEAVLGVIDAADRRELDVALAQLAGGLGDALRRLRDRLLDLLAHLEAGLDFVEEDIEFVSAGELERELTAALHDVAALVDRVQTRGDVAELARVVITGSPNVGKSSLFNVLVGHDRAIVSPQPGATRDYLTARIDLDGVQCELIDTAGVELGIETGISGAAQASSAQQRQQARLLLLCLDSTRPLNDWERRQLKEIENGPPALVVLTKTDGVRRLALSPLETPSELIQTSSSTLSGIERLRGQLRSALLASSAETGVVLTTAVRSRDSLRLAAESLARALQLAQASGGEELIAAELRIALDQLGQVVGTVYTDDVLDRIFSRFCIGK
jgi:tRNA modification GTPase